MFKNALSRLASSFGKARVRLTPAEISKCTPKEQLMAALDYHEPPFYLLDEKWRQNKRRAVFEQVIEDEIHDKIQNVAMNNLARWSRLAEPSPGIIEVVNEDWGVATLNNTERYGKMYAVLNCADAYIVGGDFLMGRAKTQEENMWGRTTCVRYVIEALAGAAPEIYLDPESMLFLYYPEKSALLNGECMLPPAITTRLNQSCRSSFVQIPRCHLDLKAVQVGLVGPEVGYYNEELNKYIIDRASSYHPLLYSEYYPFIELRLAAVDLFLKPTKIDWDDPAFVVDYRHKMGQRIDALLFACILQGQRHLILSAIGCGAFGGKPEIVASLFKDKLTRLSAFFDHVVFAIRGSKPYDINYQIFKDIMEDEATVSLALQKPRH